MIYGPIKALQIITAEEEIAQTDPASGLDPVIRMKHDTAAKHDRYVVKVDISDPRFAKPIRVLVFLPKGVIRHNLIEIDSYAECTGQFIRLKVAGEETKFARAWNGAIRIMDIPTDVEPKPITR